MADTKISALTALATPAGEDLLAIVDDPSGTPTSKKITVSSLLNGYLSLYPEAANTLALRNSTNAQAFNIYNTYTDASNYERGSIKWNSNTLEIGSAAAGTGTIRNVSILRGTATHISLQSGRTIFSASPSISNATSLQFSNGTDWNRALAFGANGGIVITNGSTGGQSLEFREMTAPSGSANVATIYAEDNGAGKTRLMVIFGSGAAQQIAIEP